MSILLNSPPVGLSVQRHGEEFARALSRTALEVLSIVAYKRPIARAGIELIRGSSSDSALDTLVQRGLVAHTEHYLLVTTRVCLDLLGLRDLADLPPLDAQLE
jgi:segregation and condensation protein B